MGGPGTFQSNLTSYLRDQGNQVTYDISDGPFDAILVINGTRHIPQLLFEKTRGARIIQRLGNVIQLHRHLDTPILDKLRTEISMRIIRFIRSHIANAVVYQSEHVMGAWEKNYGETSAENHLIYNGVDLDRFHPQGPTLDPHSGIRILSVEGTQGNDPFNIAFQLSRTLNNRDINHEVLMVGRDRGGFAERVSSIPDVRFIGRVEPADLPQYYRGSDLFLSTDILEAGCPNVVLEAMAAGTPVIGVDAGPLPELVGKEGGICVEPPFDPWKTDRLPISASLANAVEEINKNHDVWSSRARKRAEEYFGLGHMTEAYLKTLTKNDDY